MKYQLNTTNYHTFEVFGVNKKTPRSYFIPYPDRSSADAVSLRDKRYASPKVQCLSGEWDFRFYGMPADLPAQFDTDKVTFDRLDVPSCWQFRGYAAPFYVNTRFQFPYNPPKVPETDSIGTVFSWMGSDRGIGPRFQKPENEYNFVGVYRTFFDVKDLSKKYMLSFLGVCSCLDLYVNGEFVGYSEGSHNIAEFDISDITKLGQNEILAVVHRWCNGTYLEAQDMFRNNGIFRDVLLYVTDPVDFWDVNFQTKKTGDTYTATVSAELTGDAEVTFTLEGNGLEKKQTVKSENGKAEVTFADLAVKEWNAEEPVLYNLYFEIPGSCVKVRVGFREIRIDGKLFKVNGRLVKFHGVNHHDTSSTNGYTMTPEEIEKDVKVCKEFNIDTIRTSHYPPDPYMMELCDELGIYVVDETDLETHGTFSHVFPPSYDRISDDLRWKDHYVDRVSRMYQRDKMHVSVIMWSLGNESGGTKCTDAECDYLKQYTDIPVHYESVIHCKRKAYDVGSQMYPPVSRVHEVGAGTCSVKQLLDRPYFLCEYAHAMGVGPGNIEAYWQEIYRYDNLMGGCIWEMVDHAVLHEDGSYTYGGDHGEWEHDSNFCVDGIFYPDRTPSTGAKIARFTYRPIRVTWLSGSNFELFNTTGFTDGSAYRLECEWSDGRSAVVIPDVAPLEKKRVKIVPEKEAPEGFVPFDGDLLFTVKTIDTRTGRQVAEEQVVLEKRPKARPVSAGKTAIPAELSVEGGAFALKIGEDTMTAAGPATILYRVGTDNDNNVMMVSTMQKFYNEKETVTDVKREDKSCTVTTKISCAANRYTCTDIYENTDEGILVTSRLHCDFGVGNLPRFGKTYRLGADYCDVNYQGRCGESYCDMKDQFPVDRVSCKVADMTEPNIRPQESGNRCDCSDITLSNGKHKVTFVAVGGNFEVGVKPYSDLELTKMRHREDEKTSGTYVTIEKFQMGIGTGSCGPVTAAEHLYPARKDYELQFLIKVD